MNQTLVLALMAIMVGATGTAAAQNDTSVSKSEYLPIPGLSIEQRHMECVDDPDCTLEERLMLMEEMNDEMAAMLERMNETCMELDYEACIDPRSAANEQWHKMHNHSGEMMFSMEITSEMGPFMTEYEPERERQQRMEQLGEEMGRQEPAAGNTRQQNMEQERAREQEQLQRPPATEERKSWWQRLFGSDDTPNGESSVIEYE